MTQVNNSQVINFIVLHVYLLLPSNIDYYFSVSHVTYLMHISGQEAILHHPETCSVPDAFVQLDAREFLP
jgi:hypothetical protein